MLDSKVRWYEATLMKIDNTRDNGGLNSSKNAVWYKGEQKLFSTPFSRYHYYVLPSDDIAGRKGSCKDYSLIIALLHRCLAQLVLEKLDQNFLLLQSQ